LIPNRTLLATAATAGFPSRTRARRACAFLVAAFLAVNAPAAAPVYSSGAPQSGKAGAGKIPPAPAAPPQAPLLKRTTTRRETQRFGYGSLLTIYGAPEGSITIEAWQKGEIEIAADIELSADTEEELARLATVNNFLLDDDVNHLRLITTGTHDRKFMKQAARDFPKKLLVMPWRIDYRIRVPAQTDLEIYAGRGALTLSGVEGALRLNAGETMPASFDFTGGDAEATIQGGAVRLRVGARSWRGRGVSIRLGRGDLTVELPSNFSGDINAEVLRAGRVENNYAGLEPRERTKPTERSLQGRAGAGGAILSLTVGDGTLRIIQEGAKQ
jgi:hypothetical protein